MQRERIGERDGQHREGRQHEPSLTATMTRNTHARVMILSSYRLGLFPSRRAIRLTGTRGRTTRSLSARKETRRRRHGRRLPSRG
jgi:hypothetical protein